MRARTYQRAAEVNAARQLAKTHCPANHPYSGENLVRLANGDRKCRICRSAQMRRWHERQRLKNGAAPLTPADHLQVAARNLRHAEYRLEACAALGSTDELAGGAVAAARELVEAWLGRIEARQPRKKGDT